MSEGLEWKKRHSWRHQNAPCLGERAWFDFAATCVQKQCPQCHSGSSHTDQRPCSPPPHPASPATNPQYDPTTPKTKKNTSLSTPTEHQSAQLFSCVFCFFHYFLQFFSVPVQCLSLFALKSSVSHRTKTSSPATVSKSTIHLLIHVFQHMTIPGWWFCFNPYEKYDIVKLRIISPNYVRGENKRKYIYICIYMYIYIVYVCVWLKQPPPSYSYINI